MSWEEISYILRSKTRRAVLAKLEKAKTPSVLAGELHLSLANVSRALRELRSRGLIELLTPDARAGKIFIVSDKGRAVLSRVTEMETD